MSQKCLWHQSPLAGRRYCEDWYQTICWNMWWHGLCRLSRPKLTSQNEYGKMNTVPQQDAYYISTPAICISCIQWVAGDKNCMKFSKKEFLVELWIYMVVTAAPDKRPLCWVRHCSTLSCLTAQSLSSVKENTKFKSQSIHHGQEVITLAAGTGGRFSRLSKLSHDLSQLSIGLFVLKWTSQRCTVTPMVLFGSLKLT